jgi:hypothetical protein
MINGNPVIYGACVLNNPSCELGPYGHKKTRAAPALTPVLSVEEEGY